MKITPTTKAGPEGKPVKVYLIRYQDKSKLNASGKPVHRQETFEKRKQAEARLLVLQNEMADGTHQARGEKRTVAAICELFLRHQEDRAKDGRIGKHRYQTLDIAVRRSLLRFLGGKVFADLTHQDIDDFYTSMIRVGGLSPRSAKERVGDLRQVEEFAIKRKLLVKRVVADAKTDLATIPHKPIRTFNIEQVKHLLQTAAVRGRFAQWRSFLAVNCFVNVAAFCGLRFGEIAALKLDALDFENSVIRVRHSYSRLDGLKAPKTRAGVRDVPMPAHVASLLREWIATQFKENDLGLVFLTDNTPFVAASFGQSHWLPLLRRAGLYKDGDDPFHFHALRHFAASWLAETLPMADVAQMLGHSKFDVTLQVYAHPIVAEARRQEAVAGLASKLLPAPPQRPTAPVCV